MKKTIKATYLDIENGECLLEFESAIICPRCKTALIPQTIAAAVYSQYIKMLENQKVYVSTVFYFCPKCCRCFITTSKASKISTEPRFKTTEIGISEPIDFQGSVFQKNVTTLSPKFVEIYNQSECAESNNLHHIAGMGYRKALEFLIKDYAVHMNNDKKNEIEKMSIAECIKKYIDNNNIKILAEKAAWLGNDETHYIKKHIDRDVSDLKNFIQACANYIEMELTIEDANSITKMR